MNIYFCPKCGNPGTKTPARNICRKCNSRRTSYYATAEYAAKPRRITAADQAAMRGFNPLSQDYLTRKLV